MKTSIDKAGRVVIPAAIRERAGLVPGSEIDVTVDETGVRLERVAPARGSSKSDAGSLPGRPARRTAAPVDVAALVEEERKRWP